MVMVWWILPVYPNGIKPAMFYVMRVKQHEPRTSSFSSGNSTYAAQANPHVL